MAEQVDVSAALAEYVREMSLREDEVLRELREETAELPGGHSLQVMPEEGQFLGLLVSLLGARSVLELGTYTGYSTLCMARALPSDGRLLTCDITGRWADIGVPFWRRAGVEDLIDSIIAGVRSACTYAGAADLRQFADLATVGIQSPSGYEEGRPLHASW